MDVEEEIAKVFFNDSQFHGIWHLISSRRFLNEFEIFLRKNPTQLTYLPPVDEALNLVLDDDRPLKIIN